MNRLWRSADVREGFFGSGNAMTVQIIVSIWKFALSFFVYCTPAEFEKAQKKLIFPRKKTGDGVRFAIKLRFQAAA